MLKSPGRPLFTLPGNRWVAWGLLLWPCYVVRRVLRSLWRVRWTTWRFVFLLLLAYNLFLTSTFWAERQTMWRQWETTWTASIEPRLAQGEAQLLQRIQERLDAIDQASKSRRRGSGR